MFTEALDAWKGGSRVEWTSLIPLAPLHLYDVWNDLVKYKQLMNWRLKMMDEYFVIFGSMPIQMLYDGKRSRHEPLSAPESVAIICLNDVAECDLESLAQLRSQIASNTPGLHSVYMTISNAAPSIHYYAIQDSLS
ncbi:hypothetical protein THRCLA_22024 [Thraustotheca clavata]|uniref:Uncharacterized protein n=1 Tax=Thraustotheca clavata TaxID=74557 RepID=A0A1V9ZDI7_9STRA|nr:hypothetical protein THRCLA_22024 [Thraustotheca clavata]